jgi:hypothetical protein
MRAETAEGGSGCTVDSFIILKENEVRAMLGHVSEHVPTSSFAKS